MKKNSNLSLNIFFLIALLLILDTAAQIFFKMAVTHLGEFPTGSFTQMTEYMSQLATNYLLASGVMALIVAFFIWLVLISKVDLSFAHPMTSLMYATIPLCSSWLLHEPFNWKQSIGIALIVLGVFVVSYEDSAATPLKSE